MPAPTAGSTRSSSAARLRPRSRDRGGRYPRASMQFQAEERFRTQPAGPQEEQDWTAALETVTDRLDTLDRMSRLHGQSIFHIEEDRGMLLGKLTSAVDALEKTNVDRSNNIHARINEGGDNIRTELLATRDATASKFLELEAEIALRDSRIELMAGQIQSLANGLAISRQVERGGSGLPKTFEVHTPPVITAPPPPH